MGLKNTLTKILLTTSLLATPLQSNALELEKVRDKHTTINREKIQLYEYEKEKQENTAVVAIKQEGHDISLQLGCGETQKIWEDVARGGKRPRMSQELASIYDAESLIYFLHPKDIEIELKKQELNLLKGNKVLSEELVTKEESGAYQTLLDIGGKGIDFVEKKTKIPVKLFYDFLEIGAEHAQNIKARNLADKISLEMVPTKIPFYTRKNALSGFGAVETLRQFNIQAKNESEETLDAYLYVRPGIHAGPNIKGRAKEGTFYKMEIPSTKINSPREENSKERRGIENIANAIFDFLGGNIPSLEKKPGNRNEKEIVRKKLPSLGISELAKKEEWEKTPIDAYWVLRAIYYSKDEIDGYFGFSDPNLERYCKLYEDWYSEKNSPEMLPELFKILNVWEKNSVSTTNSNEKLEEMFRRLAGDIEKVQKDVANRIY